MQVLEFFARYIANSWKRLEMMSDLQRVRSRELALNRKELAALLLSGHVGDPGQLKALTENVGLGRLPDRVMVLRKPPISALAGTNPDIAKRIALNRTSHIVEDLCQNWPNTLCVATRPGEICILTGLDSRNSGQRITLQERAESVRAVVREAGVVGADRCWPGVSSS